MLEYKTSLNSLEVLLDGSKLMLLDQDGDTSTGRPGHPYKVSPIIIGHIEEMISLEKFASPMGNGISLVMFYRVRPLIRA